MTPLIQLSDVAKGFGPNAATSPVLTKVNLEVREGEFLAIVGFSGSGKSTLINLLAGLQTANKGTVTFNGAAMPPPGPDRALVFQNYSLLPWLTVFENIALAVNRVFPDWSAEKRRVHIEEHIAKVSLTPARNKRPRELSGGMRQRVAVARALAMDPRVLLLDEPLGALDALTRGTLQDEISRIWQENRKTVVLITNDPDEAILLADRVIPLSPGPSATLGPSFVINMPRPRDRKELNHHPDFKRLRAEITSYLLEMSASRCGAGKDLPRHPDLLPEDISLGRPMFAWGERPKRRGKMPAEVPAA